MIATFWVVERGPWPGQDGADVDGVQSAADIIAVIERRLFSGEAAAEDRTRYRIACATIERAARKIGTPVAHVDATDLLAWFEGQPLRTVHTPTEVAEFAQTSAAALHGSGGFGKAVAAATRKALAAQAGLVITVEPSYLGSADVVRSDTRPPRPVASRVVEANPELAELLDGVERSADDVFASDRWRLRSTQRLREQIRLAVATGEPLPIGMQAKHEVLTEAFRELHHPGAPSGMIRLLYAAHGAESPPFRFGPLPARPYRGTKVLSVGLMSIRHTEADAEVSGYWFRNRLVSVPGRSQAEDEAYCYRDSVPRLHRLADEGVTDLVVRHTGYEPAAIGFYRAVAEVIRERDLRVQPQYLIGARGVVAGTPWPRVADV